MSLLHQGAGTQCSHFPPPHHEKTLTSLPSDPQNRLTFSGTTALRNTSNVLPSLYRSHVLLSPFSPFGRCPFCSILLGSLIRSFPFPPSRPQGTPTIFFFFRPYFFGSVFLPFLDCRQREEYFSFLPRFFLYCPL